jgi:hypothetical protein
VSGLNNEYGKGCLVVLDPDNFEGMSPQKKQKYLIPDLPIGSQILYILFPRTDVDLLIHTVEAISYIEVFSNHVFQVGAIQSSLIYEFDYNLDFQRIIESNKFKDLHRDALADGKITSTLDEEYLKDLENRILYYSDGRWTRR